MTPNQILLMIKARLWLLLAILAGVIISATIVSLSWSKSYTATAAVLLDVKSPDPIAGMVLSGMQQPSYMSTQIDILRSERVMKGVIQKLGFDQSEQMRDMWAAQTGSTPGTYTAWLSSLLLQNLSAVPARESNVINVSFTTTDPVLAARVTNAVVESYIETTLDLRVEPAKQYEKLFDVQAKAARERLQAAQNKLSDYQREHQVLATDERLDIENSRLAELSSQLVGMQGAQIDAASRQNAANKNFDSSPEVLSNPVVSNLRVELASTASELKKAQATMGDAHPVIQQLKAKLTEVQSRLETENSKVRSSLSVASASSSMRAENIKAALERQRQHVLKLKAERDEVQVRLRDVETAQQAYDRIVSRLQQTSLESQSTQTNVSIVKQASTPFSHSSPKVGLNIGLAAVVGLIFAIGVVVLLELWDRRLRSADDISLTLDLPMLGTITDSKQEIGPDRDVLKLPGPGATTPPPNLPKLTAPAQ